MPKTIPRYERLNDLEIQLLRAPEGLSCELIAQMYAVDRTTAYRDVQTLVHRGVPITQVGHLWRIDTGTLHAHANFTLLEATTLYLGLRLFTRQSDEQNPYLVSALTKFSEALSWWSPHLARLMQQSAQAVAQRPEHPHYVPIFDVMVRGWLEQRQIVLLYHSATSDTPRRRRFSPYFLEPANGGFAIYAIGQDEDLQEIRTLKLERIIEADLTEEPFTIPPAYTPEVALHTAWSIMWGEGVVEVRLRFLAGVVRRLQETLWHHSQHLVLLPDGNCEFSVRVGHLLEITPWIRSWGANVEVLAPPELRQQFAVEAQQLVTYYQPGHSSAR